jgi:Nucleoside-diphosphate-sugar pyrophosphorylase involved in lipopolysaccharide biosynthesis/translation initiation factor 2B, gamma/epsilon subunits (eIF-2Bgamma/eIF-2Bepsilon)
MKAVVLVGGFGTRLRPLTETVKKELLPLVDRPILDHVLDHLARHGVHEVILSSPYLEEAFHPFIEARRGDPAITWITEAAPLGTGGAIVNALDAVGNDPFFALNGDILTDLDLTGMLGSHRERDAVVTISLHHVEDARAFGLVATDERGRVLEFLEKPLDAIPGDVNAGTYILDPAALRPWSADRELSIEREIFPSVIASGGPVYGYLSDAYWLDLGTPEKYLQAHFDMLDGKVHGVTYEAPWVAATAGVDPGSRLGRWVASAPRHGWGPTPRWTTRSCIPAPRSGPERACFDRSSARAPTSAPGPRSRTASWVRDPGCRTRSRFRAARADGYRSRSGVTTPGPRPSLVRPRPVPPAARLNRLPGTVDGWAPAHGPVAPDHVMGMGTRTMRRRLCTFLVAARSARCRFPSFRCRRSERVALVLRFG